jgi:hypothetical protein
VNPRIFYSLAAFLLVIGAIAMAVRYLPGSPAPKLVEKVKLIEGAKEPTAASLKAMEEIAGIQTVALGQLSKIPSEELERAPGKHEMLVSEYLKNDIRVTVVPSMAVGVSNWTSPRMFAMLISALDLNPENRPLDHRQLQEIRYLMTFWAPKIRAAHRLAQTQLHTEMVAAIDRGEGLTDPRQDPTVDTYIQSLPKHSQELARTRVSHGVFPVGRYATLHRDGKAYHFPKDKLPRFVDADRFMRHITAGFVAQVTEWFFRQSMIDQKQRDKNLSLVGF